MTPLPNLEFLRAFVTAAEERSAKAAAERLGITPSAVSQAIAKLERQAGAELFVKHARPLKLTPAGSRLAGEARALVEAAEGLLPRAAGEDLSSRTVRLGLGETVSATFAPWLMARLMKRVGRLETETRLTHPLIERLGAGELDVIVTGDPMLDDERWLRVPALRRGFSPLPQAAGLRRGGRTDRHRGARRVKALHRVRGRKLGRGRNRAHPAHARRAAAAPHARLLIARLVGLVSETDGWALLPPTNLWCGRMFLENLVVEPVPAGVRRRRMWAVGDRRTAGVAVMLAAETARQVFREHMIPALDAALAGLSQHVALKH